MVVKNKQPLKSGWFNPQMFAAYFVGMDAAKPLPAA